MERGKQTIIRSIQLDEAELDKRSKEKKEGQHGKQKGRIKGGKKEGK